MTIPTVIFGYIIPIDEWRHFRHKCASNLSTRPPLHTSRYYWPFNYVPTCWILMISKTIFPTVSARVKSCLLPHYLNCLKEHVKNDIFHPVKDMLTSTTFEKVNKFSRLSIEIDKNRYSNRKRTAFLKTLRACQSREGVRRWVGCASRTPSFLDE